MARPGLADRQPSRRDTLAIRRDNGRGDRALIGIDPTDARGLLGLLAGVSRPEYGNASPTPIAHSCLGICQLTNARTRLLLSPVVRS